jgi:hypothetical protein
LLHEIKPGNAIFQVCALRLSRLALEILPFGQIMACSPPFNLFSVFQIVAILLTGNLSFT